MPNITDKIAFAICGILLIAVTLTLPGRAATTPTEWVWTVPDGVDKIKVTSVRDDNTVLNTTFKVEPGQTFKVEAVE